MHPKTPCFVNHWHKWTLINQIQVLVGAGYQYDLITRQGKAGDAIFHPNATRQDPRRVSIIEADMGRQRARRADREAGG